jgi:hypothetical protein
LGWLEKLSRIGGKFFNPFCSSYKCKKVSINEMKLFFKNIWLFSKTNDAIYSTKYCSRAAGELIEVLMNAAENGKQLVNLILLPAKPPAQNFFHPWLKFEAQRWQLPTVDLVEQ